MRAASFYNLEAKTGAYLSAVRQPDSFDVEEEEGRRQSDGSADVTTVTERVRCTRRFNDISRAAALAARTT
jgi:hypothetical protein